MLAKSINLGMTFLLELCMLAALFYWGLQASDSTILRLGLAIVAPLLAVLIWGRFMAPRSRTRLSGWSYLILKSILFGVAALALAMAGQVTLAIVFVVVAVINQLLLLVWKQDAGQVIAPSGTPSGN